MKLEEVIERLKDDVKYADLRDTVNDDCTICFIEDIETLLKSYEELKKENEDIKRILSYEIEYREKLEEDLYKRCSNFVIPKDKIREKIEELEDEFAKKVLEDLLKEG